jgi:hypothetical protein
MTQPDVRVFYMASFSRSGETLLLRHLAAHEEISVPYNLEASENETSIRVLDLMRYNVPDMLSASEALELGISTPVVVAKQIWEHPKPFNGFILVRNPVSVVASIIRHLSKGEDAQITRNGYLRRWAGYVDEGYSGLIDSCSENDAFISMVTALWSRRMRHLLGTGLPIVHYERLVTDPATCLHKIISLFGMSGSTAVIEAHTAYANQHLGHGGNDLSRAIDGNSLSVYRSVLTAEQINLIKVIGYETARLYGYQLYGSEIAVAADFDDRFVSSPAPQPEGVTISYLLDRQKNLAGLQEQVNTIRSVLAMSMSAEGATRKESAEHYSTLSLMASEILGKTSKMQELVDEKACELSTVINSGEQSLKLALLAHQTEISEAMQQIHALVSHTAKGATDMAHKIGLETAHLVAWSTQQNKEMTDLRGRLALLIDKEQVRERMVKVLMVGISVLEKQNAQLAKMLADGERKWIAERDALNDKHDGKVERERSRRRQSNTVWAGNVTKAQKQAKLLIAELGNIGAKPVYRLKVDNYNNLDGPSRFEANRLYIGPGKAVFELHLKRPRLLSWNKREIFIANIMVEADGEQIIDGELRVVVNNGSSSATLSRPLIAGNNDIVMILPKRRAGARLQIDLPKPASNCIIKNLRILTV